MSLSTCKVCTRSYRTGRIAFIMGEHGKLSGARVCQDCASDGVLVVAAKAAARCKCGKAATRCGTCTSDAQQKDRSDALRGAIRALEAMQLATAPTNDGSEFILGRVNGLESAIHLLESGRF